MAKKAKSSVEKIVKKVNKEFEKTSAQIEGLISDAMKQFDTLQNQVQDPLRKLLKEVDELREREKKRFNKELERRLEEFNALQSGILERLGVASKEEIRKATKESEKELKKTPSKKTTPPKASAKKSRSARPRKPTDRNDLTLIKGIGPATAKKMNDAGITSIDQIANPSPEDQEKLNAFSSMKGFAQLTDEAKKIN